MSNVSSQQHILLVDDDNDLRSALSEQLQFDKHFKVSEAETGQAGIDFATHKSNAVDIIILDVGLPDYDGREVCRNMRKLDVLCPIVMLTAQDTDRDTIAGFEAGANDYVSKPFKFAVLLARIQTHLNQYAQSEHATVKIGPYAFKISAKTLTDENGEQIRLTDKEANILRVLKKAGCPVDRRTLLDEIWGYNSAVTTHTLETHIYRLRQKIEKDPSNATILVRGEEGYALK